MTKARRYKNPDWTDISRYRELIEMYETETDPLSKITYALDAIDTIVAETRIGAHFWKPAVRAVNQYTFFRDLEPREISARAAEVSKRLWELYEEVVRRKKALEQRTVKQAAEMRKRLVRDPSSPTGWRLATKEELKKRKKKKSR